MATPSAATASERRQATILFADIAGFTALSETLDPEEVTAIVNSFYAIARRVIVSHGGTVDKFIGDSVMALFGVPIALEQAPRKAIEAAIGLMAEFRAFSSVRAGGPPLELHIGINSGTVVSGGMGSEGNKDFTVIGDAVNLASRLEGVAKAGQIIVGPLTWRYEREHFRFAEGKPVTVKGKSEAVQVWELLGELEDCEEGSVQDRAIQSVLVGREAELGKLGSQAALLHEGSGSIVSLIGDAGLGKSRLCAEFRASEAMKGFTVLEGRALSSGRTLSYWPIIEIIKSWASIGEDDGEEAALGRLEAAIRAVLPETYSDVFPYLSVLIGLKPRGEAGKAIEGTASETMSKLIARSCRELIGAATGLRPILFILEDLHWADESTLELVRSLSALVEEKPIMFLLVYRPGFGPALEAFRTALAGRHPTRLVDIALDALGSGESETLVRNLLRAKGFPESVMERIVKNSEGNPFFIEEVIRSFIDSGAIRAEGGGFVAGDGIVEASVPNGINEVIMARVDRLDPKLKELLRVASVNGRIFFGRVIEKVAEEPDCLGERMGILQEMQLVRERRRMGELEYLFKHVLVQEAIYNSLLISTRRELHLLVAKAIEECFPDRANEFLGMLAWHYSRGEDTEKAEEFLEKAGRVALESGASSEALVFLKEALESYKKKVGSEAVPERLAVFEALLAKATLSKGRNPEALRYYDEALRHLGVEPPQGLALTLQAVLGIARMVAFIYLPFARSRRNASERESGILDTLVERFQSLSMSDDDLWLLTGFAAIKDGLKWEPSTNSRILANIGTIPAFLSLFGLFHGTSKRILEMVEKTASDEHARAMFEWGAMGFNLLHGESRLEYKKATVDVFIKKGGFIYARWYLTWAGYGLSCAGRFEEVEEIGRMLESLALDFDMPPYALGCLAVRTLAHLSRRESSDALRLVEELLERSERVEEPNEYTFSLSYKLMALVQADRLDESDLVVQEMHKLMAAEKMKLVSQIVPVLEAIVFHGCARLEAEPDSARRAVIERAGTAQAARLVRTARKYAYYKASALRIAGTWDWLTGKRKKALALWVEGLEVAERLELLPELGKIRLEAAKRFLNAGAARVPGAKTSDGFELSGEGSRALLDNALAIFGKLGLAKDAEEARQLVDAMQAQALSRIDGGP